MTLIEKLYPKDDKYLQRIWHTFVLFNPKMHWLKQKFVEDALSNNERKFFIGMLQGAFFPGQDDEFIQKEFTTAINKGIGAVNSLLEMHMPECGSFFRINEVPKDTNFFEMLQSAYEDCKSGKIHHSKHPRDYSKLLSAYSNVRAFGLGRIIKNVEQSPEILDSLKRYELILKWFNEGLSFEPDSEGTWKTAAGVKIYGKGKPIRSRIKILESDTDKIKYGSILMKMLLKCMYPNEITDRVGVEFIVGDDTDRKKLINYFQTHTSFTGQLENFTRYERGKSKENKHSNNDFGFVKFTLRPPCRVDSITQFRSELGAQIYTKPPVEVQILTLNEDEERKSNPNVRHEEYKRSQFGQIFPAIFPKMLYRPFIEDFEAE